ESGREGGQEEIDIVKVGQENQPAQPLRLLFSSAIATPETNGMIRVLPRVIVLPVVCQCLPAFINSLHAKRVIATGSQASSSGAGYRFDKGGWKYVHLEGTPSEIGYQHGQLLAAEIADLVSVMKVESQHDTKRDWNFYREAGRKMLWAHIDEEYQQEI